MKLLDAATIGAFLTALGMRQAEPAAERDDYDQVMLAERRSDALARPNPALSAELLDDACRCEST
jgi:hypothetical protein